MLFQEHLIKACVGATVKKRLHALMCLRLRWAGVHRHERLVSLMLDQAEVVAAFMRS
jgi:hypothetical protein